MRIGARTTIAAAQLIGAFIFAGLWYKSCYVIYPYEKAAGDFPAAVSFPEPSKWIRGERNLCEGARFLKPSGFGHVGWTLELGVGNETSLFASGVMGNLRISLISIVGTRPNRSDWANVRDRARSPQGIKSFLGFGSEHYRYWFRPPLGDDDESWRTSRRVFGENKWKRMTGIYQVSCFYMPFALCILALSLHPLYVFAFIPLRRLLWRNRGKCPNCGYDLRGSLAGRCSECGS